MTPFVDICVVEFYGGKFGVYQCREMNQEDARRLLLEGGTLLVLDVPEGTNFGIDLKSWETGERFKGVKMIPPGLHFVYHRSMFSL